MMTRASALPSETPLESDLGLHGNELSGDALLALLEVLADANDDGEACCPERSTCALLNGDVGIAEVGAALAVAGDDVLNAA